MSAQGAGAHFDVADGHLAELAELAGVLHGLRRRGIICCEQLAGHGSTDGLALNSWR